jgi:hypothetical protein
MMVKFHWTLDEIKKIPLSTFGELQKLMEWEQKEIERMRRDK